MVRFELVFHPAQAQTFDRFFWSLMDDDLFGDDCSITLTAYSAGGSERRIVTVETPEQERAFRRLWGQSGYDAANVSHPRESVGVELS